jgi:K+-sensing histidine kinase KdpD
LLLVVVLVYLYFRARLYYLFKERKRLENLVAAKTNHQVRLIDQLQDSIAEMTQLQQELEQLILHKENIIAVLIHDIKSPLYFLNTVANHLHKGIEQNPVRKSKEIACEIANSLHRLYLFTQDFAAWLNASQPGQLQKRETVEISKIIEEALAVYQEIIHKKNISVQQDLVAKMVWGDELMIKCVVRNLIDNAVKNATGGTILIATSYTGDEQFCEMTFADEGKGMPREQIKTLNQYFEYGEELFNFSDAGFGHKVIKDFLFKLQGRIHYCQNFPTGIIVTVKLPAIHFTENFSIEKCKLSNSLPPFRTIARREKKFE